VKRDTVFSLRLDPEQREMIAREAKAQRLSESDVIRIAIERYLFQCINDRAAGRIP
jgi:uncharacterized protein (DUF1778 family)